MSDSDSTPSPAPAPVLVAERTGKLTYVGRNERGAQVRIGPEGDDGVFSPGELLAIAVAACVGMSADSRIAADLGDDVDIAVGVTRTKDAAYERYSDFAVELVVDGTPLTQEKLLRMITTAHKAIDRYCTVSRTVKNGAGVDVTITSAP